MSRGRGFTGRHGTAGGICRTHTYTHTPSSGRGFVFYHTYHTPAHTNGTHRPTSQAGGALYAAAGSCITSLRSSAFDGNGNIHGLANGTGTGGGLMLQQPACATAISRCAFARNAAGTGAGVSVSGVAVEVVALRDACCSVPRGSRMCLLCAA